MCETENCSKAPCHRRCRGNTAVVPVCPRRGAGRGHPTWTCPRVFCARPTGSAFTPALPAPISLLLPPVAPSLLLFPFPFSSLPLLLHFPAGSQDFRPPDLAAFVLSHLPLIFLGWPRPPAHTLGCSAQPSTIAMGTEGPSWRGWAASRCSARLGCWALQPKKPSISLPSATQDRRVGRGAFGFVVPLPSLGIQRPGSAQGAQGGRGCSCSLKLHRELLLFLPFVAYGLFSCPSPPLPPLHPNKPLESTPGKAQMGSVSHSRSLCCHTGTGSDPGSLPAPTQPGHNLLLHMERVRGPTLWFPIP